MNKGLLIAIGAIVLLGLAYVFMGGDPATETETVAETEAETETMVEAVTEPAAEPTEEAVLNIYSSRHYDTDERLYSDFTAATGIEVRRIEDKADALIARMEAEGANSPADILLTTDAGRLWAAAERGLFQPVNSEVLQTKIPAHLRHPDNIWFGFSKRARIIFFDKARVTAEDVTTYQDLADPKFNGMVCTRTSSNIYMLSLMAAIIENHGEEAAKSWAEGVYANRARDPEGGDTDQLRGIASGECGLALANTYYFARALRTDVRGLGAEETSKIGHVFPDQEGSGTHVNVSGGGIAVNAPHPKNAKAFLEYLASEQAQRYFAEGNDEYPVVEGILTGSPVGNLGAFNEDDINLSVLGINQPKAQEIYDSVGYK
jgi:iron(III) transport system substrate-binding protein